MISRLLNVSGSSCRPMARNLLSPQGLVYYWLTGGCAYAHQEWVRVARFSTWYVAVAVNTYAVPYAVYLPPLKSIMSEFVVLASCSSLSAPLFYFMAIFHLKNAKFDSWTFLLFRFRNCRMLERYRILTFSLSASFFSWPPDRRLTLASYAQTPASGFV